MWYLGHPSTGHTDENMEKDCRIINEDQRSIILGIACSIGLTYGTYRGILTERLLLNR
jgi:hypothetical protein